MTKAIKTLTLDNLNPSIKLMEYAIRGPLIERASEIERELQQGAKKPFKEVIKANLGDCHAMGQAPITFIRQVLSLVANPKLLTHPSFANDAKEKAKLFLSSCRGGSIGSYTDSAGIEAIRKHVAEYIERRDGHPANWEHVSLSEGASNSILSVLKLLKYKQNNLRPGVMIPVPIYQLYPAYLTLLNMEHIEYYLDEDKNWSLDIAELERALDEARKVCNPRAIVVINPGNPTGQVATRENIEDIIKFAYKEKLFLLADEVYQDNVYAPGSKFFSFKKVLTEMGEPYSQMELASFHSCSKGYTGECGLRGGYTEIVNLDFEVRKMFLKSITIMSSPTILGQCAMDCVVAPPKKGDESYDLFQKEKTSLLESLKERATMIADKLNDIEGFSCNPIQGAMYAFPQFKVPSKAIAKAKSLNQCPSFMYASELLENTGICIVPGVGFGQKPGTYHFRTTILPQKEQLASMLDKIAKFHVQFVKQNS